MRLFRAFLAGLFAILIGCGTPPGLDDVRADVRRRFPEVRQVSTDELSSWLAEPARPPPILLDVRSDAEFAVSHLPGARRVELGQPAAAQLVDLSRGQQIVVYCSVGDRSSRFAHDLSAAGFAEVWNLDGSIFLWARERRPLVNADGPTTRVHPYNRSWGRLLPADMRSE